MSLTIDAELNGYTAGQVMMMFYDMIFHMMLEKEY